jgi:predicted ribosome-associated RNA-binding protein Tma20
MWPGVNSFAELGNFKKDEVVSIKNMKGEIIAVGALGCSLD